jgi:hypothetical protein
VRKDLDALALPKIVSVNELNYDSIYRNINLRWFDIVVVQWFRNETSLWCTASLRRSPRLLQSFPLEIDEKYQAVRVRWVGGQVGCDSCMVLRFRRRRRLRRVHSLHPINQGLSTRLLRLTSTFPQPLCKTELANSRNWPITSNWPIHDFTSWVILFWYLVNLSVI